MYLLSTFDDSLSAEDVALWSKQLMEVERAFRTLKATLDLRPVHHRREDRIESHVLLCRLALLLVWVIFRCAEGQTGWSAILDEKRSHSLRPLFGIRPGHLFLAVRSRLSAHTPAPSGEY